jgi:hypothetical protein
MSGRLATSAAWLSSSRAHRSHLASALPKGRRCIFPPAHPLAHCLRLVLAALHCLYLPSRCFVHVMPRRHRPVHPLPLQQYFHYFFLLVLSVLPWLIFEQHHLFPRGQHNTIIALLYLQWFRRYIDLVSQSTVDQFNLFFSPAKRLDDEACPHLINSACARYMDASVERMGARWSHGANGKEAWWQCKAVLEARSSLSQDNCIRFLYRYEQLVILLSLMKKCAKKNARLHRLKSTRVDFE